MLAGFVFQKKGLPRKPWIIAVFGFLTVVLWIGPLLDCSHIFLIMSKISWEAVLAVLLAGFYANISQAICTVITLLLFGKPILEKLDRVRIKYGMTN